MKTRLSCLAVAAMIVLASVMLAPMHVRATPPGGGPTVSVVPVPVSDYVRRYGQEVGRLLETIESQSWGGNLYKWALLFSHIVRSCHEPASPDTFMKEYERCFARFYGANVRLVHSTASRHDGAQRAYALSCRQPNSTNLFRAEIEVRCNTAGLIEAVVFDRDLTLPGGVRVRRNQPVSIETVMHAIALDRKAHAVKAAGDLVVKTLSGKASCSKPDVSGARATRTISGHVPTAFESFAQVIQFSVGAFVPGDTGPVVHTFYMDVLGLKGKDCNAYASKFILTPDHGYKRPIATFTAKLKNGEVYFTYKEWTVNPDNIFSASQAKYEESQGILESSEPVKGAAVFGGVRFAMDNEVHVVSNVPLMVKTSKSGMAFKNVKMK